MIILFLSSIFMIGCSDSNNESEQGNTGENSVNNIENNGPNNELDEENAQNNNKDNKDEEEKGAKADYDVNVMLNGKMTYEDNILTVEGESNLPEGTSLTIAPVAIDDTVFIGVTRPIQTEADGTFSDELTIPEEYKGDLLVSIAFKPGDTDDDFIHEIYGKEGEHLEGPFVRLYEYIDEVKQGIQTEVYLSLDESGRAEAEIAEPEWDIPEDLGDYDIRMDATAEADKEFIEVHGESNLIEGSELSFSLFDDEDNLTLGGGYVQAKPDGSFLQFIEIPEDAENLDEYTLTISFELSQYKWENVVEHYGEDGSKLSGELVEDEEASITIPVTTE